MAYLLTLVVGLSPLLQQATLSVHRYQMFAQKSASTVKYHFSFSQISNLSPGQEVEIEHKHYDVIAVTRVSNGWDAEVICDEIEDILEDGNAANSDAKEKNGKFNIPKDWITLHYNITHLNYIYIYSPLRCHNPGALNQTIREVIGPPPEFLG